MADIFVSYTSSDRDWAFWIAKELEALGHAPLIHEWEINSGQDIYAWMEQRHDAADHVLCVISDAYLKAPYSTLERNAALWQAASKRPGFVLLVAVKPCRLPTLADHIRRCELYGISEQAARDRFGEFIAKRAAPAVIAFPGEEFAVSNIPIRVPAHFSGREDSFAAIETALASNASRVAITALHGLRGVGKTTLAACYAERHRGHYRATWWIRAQTEPTMRTDLVGLGVRLRWVAADEKEEPAIAAVMERLRNEGAGILLIYDNALDAETLRPYLPRGGAARVLVTSNAHAWRGIAEPVEIKLWPKQTGGDFLIARTGRRDEHEAADALSEALGGLPLAHEQAAAYCERLAMSFADYRRRFEAMPAMFLDDSRHAPAEYHDGLTVAKTFALAIDEAATLHAAAEPLIVYAALLAPEPVPLLLFSEAPEKFGEPVASALRGDGVIEAVAALRAFALLDRETVRDGDGAVITEAIRLHRLVREVAAARRQGEALEQSRCGLIAALAAVYPKDGYRNPASWPRCAVLTPHLRTACDMKMTDATANATCADLLNRAAEYHCGRAAYAAARPLFERALAICEQALGPQHADTAEILNNLGTLLCAQSDFVAARPLFDRALAIYEKALGPEHPNVAETLNNLGSLLYAQGNLTEARPLFERALAIDEKVLGEQHISTATNFNNLASLLQAQSDLAASRTLFERALAIYEKMRGPEHPDIATCLANLARLLRAQGDHAGARALFERALAIDEKALGPEHPQTATSLNDIAMLLQEHGDLAAAHPLFQRALAIQQKVRGPEHPDTATSLNNLAMLLQDQSEFAQAQTLFERALAIREKVCGGEHPDTATSLNNLGGVLQDLGDLAQAQLLYERALVIYEKALGPEHADTASVLSNLGCVLRDTGHPREAEPLLLRAVATGERLLGREDPLTQRYACHYARLLVGNGRSAEALAIALTALAEHEQAFGPNHPWTKDSAGATADALDAQARPDEAAVLRARFAIGDGSARAISPAVGQPQWAGPE